MSYLWSAWSTTTYISKATFSIFCGMDLCPLLQYDGYNISATFKLVQKGIRRFLTGLFQTVGGNVLEDFSGEASGIPEE